ncbi:hypothetical protein MWU52_05360 [Jannaschia sp. S6380]|uniref:hypothetical protein n=1 Tax=Jannaschia sp. S6380 TaxID=2926408 RepID=UPI001FF68822|nr:hypothetical protein [Jannaschia sp. S6380]MCK0166974.1 hypothetical protein [Jannaschia sp. S6380]
MAENVSITSPGTTKLDASVSDRIALHVTNALYEEALKADWAFHASKLSQDSVQGADLGHEAACAWASCIEALRDLQDMSEVDPRIADAAAHLEAMMPPVIPDIAEMGTRFSSLVEEAKSVRERHPELAEVLQQTGCLIHVHGANLELMSLRQAA